MRPSRAVDNPPVFIACFRPPSSYDRSPRYCLGAASATDLMCARPSSNCPPIILSMLMALQSVQAATTIRIRNGKAFTTDGPFAETKEQLGGFFLIEARDLNDAIRVASKIPPARLGCIEVRPINEMPR